MSTSSFDSSFLLTRRGSEDSGNDSCVTERIDRYSRLLTYLKNAIETISSGVSEEQYVYYLSMLSVIKKSRSVPGKIHKKLKASLVVSLSTEIQETIKEENIKENLQKLEKLVDESVREKGQVAWRPNGCVKDHLRSHFMEEKQKYRDELEKKIREKEQDIEFISMKVMRLRTHVRSLKSRLHMLKSHCVDSSVVDRIDKKVMGKVEDLY